MTRDAARGERVYGVSAALATFAERPESVLSIAYAEAARRPLAELLRAAARRRIAYREVTADELARMAGSVHHEGVCLLVRAARARDVRELAASAPDHAVVVALDRVENPHNVGAVLRSAAYFGATGLVIEAEAGRRLPPSARRVAEGGAEHVHLATAPRLTDALRALADEGFTVIGADAGARLDLSRLRWPARAVIVLGHEQLGLSREAKAACKTLVRIAGSGAVQSLNVSVAAGILLASYAAARGAA